MIISCLNCKKKFKIDEKLIPVNGRLLQCSSCNHKWHYKIPKNENLAKEDIISNKAKENEQAKIYDKKKSSNLTLNEINNNEINKNTNEKSYKNLKLKKEKESRKVKLTSINVLNAFFITIITFVAMILILDTFKIYIANYVPILIPLLDSLYETFIDINSFIKNLIS